MIIICIIICIITDLKSKTDENICVCVGCRQPLLFYRKIIYYYMLYRSDFLMFVTYYDHCDCPPLASKSAW